MQGSHLVYLPSPYTAKDGKELCYMIAPRILRRNLSSPRNRPPMLKTSHSTAVFRPISLRGYIWVP